MSALIEQLRRAAVNLRRTPMPLADVIPLLQGAALALEVEQKRFAEHLEAWRVNNAWHAARIAELEKELAECWERDL